MRGGDASVNETASASRHLEAARAEAPTYVRDKGFLIRTYGGARAHSWREAKTWFVTGVGRGIGPELVEQLLARGDRIAAAVGCVSI
jgi:hypothetical protein